MAQATFTAAVNDQALKNFILTGQQEAETLYNVNSTPTFIINGKVMPGAMEYDQFATVVAQAAAG